MSEAKPTSAAPLPPPLYVTDPLFQCYVNNPLVRENTFRTMAPENQPPPSFADARGTLPEPRWEGNDPVIDCYWRAWELAFGNLGPPTAANGFVANYIDTAFNGHLFLWDSVFILMFGRYGSRAFDFQRTLDNLYAKQHPDGFLCREIDIADGQDCFHRHDPSSTGPNVLAWSEWEYYLNHGDADRLRRVFPVLLAYHRWMRDYRTWPDGTYWSSGWGCGMDNQPRVPAGYNHAFSPAHQGWVDACLQAVLSAELLVRIAESIGRAGDAQDLRDEAERLRRVINERMWDEGTGFYHDLRRDGQRNSDVMSIGAYWALLANVVPPQRLERFVAHLDDPRTFNRPHRVPSLAANHPRYRAVGDYWCGGVWPSTQYMVLRGLTAVGHDPLAHAIALNHVGNVTRVYEETGTLWENYAPESAAPGDPARRDFVGWGGVGPIAVLFEYVFGLRPSAEARRLVWDVRLTDGHGVRRYPFADDALLDLYCHPRRRPTDQPVVEARASGSTSPIDLEIRWPGGRDVVRLG
jgi:hypothetical protein